MSSCRQGCNDLSEVWEGSPKKGKFDSPHHSLTMILVELYKISKSPFSGEGEVMSCYAQIVRTLTKMNLYLRKIPNCHYIKPKANDCFSIAEYNPRLHSSGAIKNFAVYTHNYLYGTTISRPESCAFSTGKTSDCAL